MLPVDWHSWRRAFSSGRQGGVTSNPQDERPGTPASPRPIGGEHKKEKPRKPFDLRGFFSGADGTRTRGLRRDRPAL